jgi:uncharacterized protein with NRDE domain
MCTLVVLHRCVPGRPLVVAANRDEFLARPAEDLAIRTTSTGSILSPLDLEAGGTWVGLSARGVFAGLTNLRPLAESGTAKLDPTSLRSRGKVVMAALEATSAVGARDALSGLPPLAYNPFQLLVADARDAFLVVYRDETRIVPLSPGAHVVGNVEDEPVARWLGTSEALTRAGMQSPSEAYPGFEGVTGLVDASCAEPRAAKLARIRGRVESLVADPGYDLFEGLARICREHEDEEGLASPFEATCVHIPVSEARAAGARRGAADHYGTRSSLLLELSEDAGSSRLWATDGPPCRRPYENRSSLLKDLGLG